MSIDVRTLTAGYGRTAVIEDVTARAEAGRITALIGPNAAGKTTLLRCVIGSLRPQVGSVHIDDRPVHRLRGSALARRLAYVPQHVAVAASFTVREVVELGRYALDPAPNRVTDALARLELDAVAETPFPALSAGQQQRVGLARAIAQMEPGGHLVLDEPTAAMDLHHAHECYRLLGDLRRDGATVLIALHDLPAAAAVADDVWLLAPAAGARTVKGARTGSVDEVMEAARLQEVFQVGFRWLDSDAPTRSLLVEPPVVAGPERPSR